MWPQSCKDLLTSVFVACSTNMGEGLQATIAGPGARQGRTCVPCYTHSSFHLFLYIMCSNSQRMKPLTADISRMAWPAWPKTQNYWFLRFVYSSYIIRSINYPHTCKKKVSVIHIVLSMCQSVMQCRNLICIIYGCSERYVWRARTPVSVSATHQWVFRLPAGGRFGYPPVSVSATRQWAFRLPVSQRFGYPSVSVSATRQSAFRLPPCIRKQNKMG